MIELGYWGLFLGSFLAATVVPFSSEALLSGMILSGGNPLVAIVVATLGNWMGGMSSYGLGHLGKLSWIERYLRVKPVQIEKFTNYINGRVLWASLLCWLPMVGDVIAVVLGLTRANIWISSVGMLAGKALRYVLWGWMTFGAMQWWQ
ncbi:membrane protein YqaA with SNARE-associated domain [Breznakibacter xylanolyticus]|uniref:Membrane protein YqaA with SNARE-associated domain n=1 Tax=Breznakibacter xylanolyticus TaxID=990 RepID=A0A2W7N842_9BACT|nr:YqaA family protein [Breznakibacter xylanolyticus]MBN2743126.1 DedA family protein [Marinilabiliaceae bacterium]PZX15873.1 membrane protein YqaA with SNARE-associated domain [Breznakibacter xylanolyticus]